MPTGSSIQHRSQRSQHRLLQFHGSDLVSSSETPCTRTASSILRLGFSTALCMLSGVGIRASSQEMAAALAPGRTVAVFAEVAEIVWVLVRSFVNFSYA